MVSMADRLTVTVDADVVLAEIRALAEEYRQIVADLRELRGKPAGYQALAEISKQAWTTTAELRRAARPTDPHGALDRWRSLATDPAPMDGSSILLGSFTEDDALVWACAAEWINETPTGLLRHAGERNGWCGLLPHGHRPLDLSDYPPTHWSPI